MRYDHDFNDNPEPATNREVKYFFLGLCYGAIAGSVITYLLGYL